MKLCEAFNNLGNGYETGVYICRKLSRDSQEEVEQLAESIGAHPFCGKDDLHVTVIYSEGTKPIPMTILQDNECKAVVTGLEFYGEQENFLVLTLESDQLKQRHRQLIRKGYLHGWDSYKPHVTIYKKISDNDKPLVKRAVERVRETFEPFVITLTGENMEPLK